MPTSITIVLEDGSEWVAGEFTKVVAPAEKTHEGAASEAETPATA